MAFAGGAAVFPGGKVDPADFEYADTLDHGMERDEAASRLAAIRETIEEAGLALALTGVEDPANCDNARPALHGGATLADVCAEQGWVPDLSKLVPWSRWRPPGFEDVSRIFDTRFYLVDAGDAELGAVVDATENKALFWASAPEVLDFAAEKKVKIIFPTRRNLERLALFDSFDRAAAHAAEFPVRMVLTYVEERANGNYICLPDGHGYPVLEESLSSAMRG